MTLPIIALLDGENATRLLAVEVGDLARVIKRDPRREQWPDLTTRQLATEVIRAAARMVIAKFDATCTIDRDVV